MAKKSCPICGGSMGYPGSYPLKDSEICMKCADDLRVCYPLIHIPGKRLTNEYLREIPECAEMSEENLKLIRKYAGEKTGYTKDGYQVKSVSIDTMHVLTLKEFKEALKGADACEDRIRMDYEDYTNVCTVEYVRPLNRTVGKEGIQNIRKRKSGYCIAGHIRAGAFGDGDMVGIYHNGTVRYADIIGIGQEDHAVVPERGELRTGDAETIGDVGDQGKRIRAGYQVMIVLNEKAKGIEPGDWIVLD